MRCQERPRDTGRRRRACICTIDARRKLAHRQAAVFNTAPKDPAGAGDSLLTCSAMALAVGANIWQGAFLGSLAAALQVGRVGNSPLTQRSCARRLDRT